MGSAWRWTSFHAPSSRRKVLVTRSSKDVGPGRPATFALHRSTAPIVARFAVRYSATVVTSVGAPSRNCAAAWSRARATSCQPRTGQAEGVRQSHIVPTGKEALGWLGVASPEGVERRMVHLHYLRQLHLRPSFCAYAHRPVAGTRSATGRNVHGDYPSAA